MKEGGKERGREGEWEGGKKGREGRRKERRREVERERRRVRREGGREGGAGLGPLPSGKHQALELSPGAFLEPGAAVWSFPLNLLPCLGLLRRACP